MKSLFALTVIFITACAIAHPGNPRVRRVQNGPRPFTNNALSDFITPIESFPIRREFVNYGYPNYLSKYLIGGPPYRPPKAPELSLLNKEIEQIENMPEKSAILYKPGPDVPWMGDYNHFLVTPAPYTQVARPSGTGQWPTKHPSKQSITKTDMQVKIHNPKPPIVVGKPFGTRKLEPDLIDDKEQMERMIFAVTPADGGYFTPTEPGFSYRRSTRTSDGLPNGPRQVNDNEYEIRQTRQNPNLGTAKNLVADDLDKLRAGFDSDILGPTSEPKNIDVFGTYISRNTVYVVAISAGIAAALILSISLFAFGCYVLVKRAKAAASVDYPAYGVTGPTVDTSGDRRLAQSAQMYHYQHQKQQIIAMERNIIEQRNGSVSDPESEEENLEGDYTVYECPGFATTGAMEVRNPLFDDPTPATPGRLQVVQAQPKE